MVVEHVSGRLRLRRIMRLALLTSLLFITTVSAVSYNSLILRAIVTSSTPSIVLLSGSQGTSIIYTNSTSARSTFQGPPYYYPGTVNIVTGSFVSGTLSSLQTVDSDRYIVRSGGTTTETVSFNPSSYTLLGSTTLGSGSVSDLASNNAVYMTFNSYPSVFSTTAPTEATLAYQGGTGGQNMIPRERTWDGTVWSSEGSLQNASSTLRWVRAAYTTLAARWLEKVVVTLAADGNLDAYVWNGTAWSLTSNIASVGATAASYRSYDIIYEKTAGRAILVYSSGGGSNDLGYRIWNGTSWLGPYNLDFTASASGSVINWVSMAAKPLAGSNEIALIAMDGTNSDVYGAIWNGTAWASQQQLETSVSLATKETIAVAYEQVSGFATLAWGTTVNNARMESRQWNGTAWDLSEVAFDGTNGISRADWITLVADPASDRLMLSIVDGSNDLNTSDWNGNTWTVHTEHDAAVNTAASRTGSVAWEPSGSKALLVWVTDTTNLSYKTWTVSGGWSTTSTFDYAGGEGQWVQTRRDPRGVGSAKILVAASDTNLDLFAVRWNGTAFLAGVTATTDLASNTYEAFDLRFEILSDPTEFIAEVEFQGSSNTNVWTQILWSVDSAWNTGSVSVTLNLYNYTAGAYPASGNGFISYTSSSTANTDEIQSQTITSNPSQFRDGSGNWKVKMKGVKSTSSQFTMKVDWLEYRPTQYNQFEASTEFVFTGITSQTASRLNFTVITQWNVASVSITIQLWNYTSSSYVTSGPGYLTYTSSSTANTDEIKTLTITSGFSTYVSGGQAKMKVLGVKSTTTQFDQGTNLDRLIYRAKYDYILQVRNDSASQSWEIRLTQTGSTGLSRLLNATFSFRGETADTLTLRPNAAGTYQQWTTFGSGSNHWDRTSDQSDSTGVQITANTTSKETQNLADASQTGTINSVTAYIRALATGSTTPERAVILWRTASTDYESSFINIGRTAFTDYSEIRTTNPNTGAAWTWSEVNALQVGSRADALGAGETIQVSEYWIVVNYSVPGPYTNQLKIINGAFTLGQGPKYTLATSTTIYIAVEVEADSSGTSTVNSNLEIFYPATTAYAQYRITFEIT